MTYSSFLSALSSLVVTGVTKQFGEPPAQLNSAQLPAQYVGLPSANTSAVTLTSLTDLLTVTAELRIAIEPLAQNMQSANWTKTVGLLDALQTALVANAAALALDEWRIGVEVAPIGDVAYWVIVATVTGSF